MHRKYPYSSLLGLLLFLVAAYFPLFLHLDALSLRLWDEARRGVNALEMLTHHQWLVPHFAGSPDLWGTKPPLLIWLQTAFMYIIGPGELAVRLPSALAGLLTALLLIAIARRVWNRPLAGYFAALVLLTSQIYIESHGAISGDYDALLTLWLTAFLFSYYLYTNEKRLRWLWLAGLFLLLGGWTKGIAAAFFLPGLFIYTCWDRSARWTLRGAPVYYVGLAAILGVLSYYLLREHLYPGYLKLVWENELGGRFLQAKEGHGRGFWFYFRILYQYDLFSPWLYVLPLAGWLLWRDTVTRSLTSLLLINGAIFLLIISAAATKLSWYCLPLLPSLALLVGGGLERIFAALAMGRSRYNYLLLGLFVIAFFSLPYIRIVNKVYHLEHSGADRSQMSYRDLFRYMPHQEEELMVVLPGYNAHFTFYQQVNRRKGRKIKGVYLQKPDAQVQTIADTLSRLDAGQLVAVCEARAAGRLEQVTDHELLWQWESCKLLRITQTYLSE